MISEIMGNALGSDDDFSICDPTRLMKMIFLFDGDS